MAGAGRDIRNQKFLTVRSLIFGWVVLLLFLRFIPHPISTFDEWLSTPSSGVVLMALAVIETVGLLFPVALMPWTAASSRAWATLFVLRAAFLAAATYFSFDVVILNDEVVGPKHAPYEFALVLCLPLSAIGLLAGRFNRRQRETATDRREFR